MNTTADGYKIGCLRRCTIGQNSLLMTSQLVSDIERRSYTFSTDSNFHTVKEFKKRYTANPSARDLIAELNENELKISILTQKPVRK